MRIRTKLLFAGLAAMLFVSVAISAASANRLSFSNPNLFRATWERLVLSDEEGNQRITCPVTLEGSFHSSTVRKVRGALIGFISNASVRGGSSAGNCTGGTVTVLLATLPWHITYDSFGGTLPRLSRITFQLHGAGAQVECIGVFCLYGDNGSTPAKATLNVEPNGLATSLDVNPEIRFAKISGGFLCPNETGYGGNARVVALPSGSNIAVRLI